MRFPTRGARFALPCFLLAATGCVGSDATRYRALDAELVHVEASDTQAPEPSPRLGAPTLERGALVAEVLRRNPTIAAARHAWRAALARYPQETALEDPMIGYGVGPWTFGSDTVPQQAHRFEASQAFPFPGKFALRGAVALGEAEAAAHDYAAVRLRLASMASMLYDEYWLLSRSLDVTTRHLEGVRELRAIADAAYESGQGTQQDPLRAEVEEAELLHREVELASARRVAALQLALLLHLDDGAALPPPPAELAPLVVDPGDAAARVGAALTARPELRAAEARVASRASAEALARREFLPDFRLLGGYDRSWDQTDMRPMVGLEMNLPLQLGRRRAAVAQARAEYAQAEAERAGLRDEVAIQVRSAIERLHEGAHLLEITRDRLVPAARDGLAAARAGFETGRSGFAELIEAERRLRSAELEADQALAEQSRRSAELAAALGLEAGIDTEEGRP